MMTKLVSYVQNYHPIVHALLIGTIIVALVSSMCMPFLAIFLMNNTKLDSASIGLIIGAGPLAATIGGFVGGFLSDMIGRKPLMILSLLFLAFSYAGIVITTNLLVLTLLTLIGGISSSFFGVVSKALMSDLTPEHKRYRVFSNRYLTANIGFSVGPVIGAFIGFGGSSGTFLLTGAAYLVYGALLVWLFHRYRIPSSEGANERLSVLQVFHVLRKDAVLFMFLIGGIMLTTVHGQMSVTLSQYLKDNIIDGVKLFGLLMSVNGLTVVLFQVKLTRWSEKYSMFRRIAFGCALFALGEVGFALSTAWFSFILAMIVFTVGEILIIPAEYAQIDLITPHGMRGTYYGAQSFTELGNFLGPWAGGLVLSTMGGTAMFFALSAVSLISLLFYWKGRQIHEHKVHLLKL